MDDLAIIELYHQREERAITETDIKYGTLCRSIALRLLGIREDAEPFRQPMAEGACAQKIFCDFLSKRQKPEYQKYILNQIEQLLEIQNREE